MRNKSLVLFFVWVLLICSILLAQQAGATPMAPSALTSVQTATGSSKWQPMGTGVNASVSALAVGSNGTTLYAGGTFTDAGGGLVYYVAEWIFSGDSGWVELQTTLSPPGLNAPVTSLALAPNGNLYVGGAFSWASGTSANSIAAWDPYDLTWYPLGTGLEGGVQTLALALDGTLYAGGAFTQAGGNSASGVAKWDGTAWSALGAWPDPSVNSVTALAIAPNGNLYALANTPAGTTYVAEWDGSTWTPLLSLSSDNTQYIINTLAADSNGILYAAGNFQDAPGGLQTNTGVIKWDGSSWTALGPSDSDVSAFLQCLIVGPNGVLYGGGVFSGAWGASQGNGVCMWNGSSWVPVGSAPFTASDNENTSVAALAMSPDGYLYAGGEFSVPANNVAYSHIVPTGAAGTLRVTITPEEVAAGAQWQVDGGSWQTSGTVVQDLSAGPHTVTFSNLSGWTPPTPKTVRIKNGQNVQVVGAYVQQKGTLSITITPQAAVTAGAKWSYNGGKTWQAAGTKVSLPVASYTVNFKPLKGWIAPESQSVTVANGQTTSTSGAYIEEGSLTVTIGPAAAVKAGARWKVDGGAWQVSEAAVGALSAGQHTVSFNSIARWTPPQSQTVTISNGAPTYITEAYTPD